MRNRSSTVFECQHGPGECFGNVLQSCVLDVLNKDQDKKVQFVACQMQGTADASGRNVCYFRLFHESFFSIFFIKFDLKEF